MDTILILTILIAGLLAIGLAAMTIGVDSRDAMTDDHRRS